MSSNKTNQQKLDHELRKWQLHHLLLILIFSLLAALINYLGNFFTPLILLITATMVLTFGLLILEKMIDWRSKATFFFVCYALLTFNLAEFGVVSWKKILIFCFAGIIYDLLQLIRTRENWWSEINQDLITILTIILLPLAAVHLLSASLALTFPLSLINMLLFCLLLTGSGTLLFHLLWPLLSRIKLTIKLRSYFAALHK